MKNEPPIEAPVLRFIGVIRTPYTDEAPYQPQDDDDTVCQLVLKPEYAKGLERLSAFKYIYVLFWLHKARRDRDDMLVVPPWSHGESVGVFASRSPNRPNPIGLSVVKLLGVVGNVVLVSSIDVFDGTPLLDIKPYVQDLDSKPDAGFGWLDEHGRDHLLLHLRGIPHDHD